MPKQTYLDNPNFDWELFGTIIRKTRKKLHYNKAEDFCASIYRRSRVEISPITYYRIECGKQEPTAMQLFGICLSLYGEPFPQKIMSACISEEWESITKSHSYADQQLFTPAKYVIPRDWREENYSAACGELREQGKLDGVTYPGASLIARKTGESEDLFVSAIPF